MERGGGRPKDVELWKNVTVLEGKKKKVKCNHCGFVFAASANRIKYHINQIPHMGIRPCNPDDSNKGTSEKQDLLYSQGLPIADKPRDDNRLNERTLDYYMSPKTMWEGINALQQVQIHTEDHQKKIKVGPFSVFNMVNESDSRLIQYVFEQSCETIFSSRCLYLEQSHFTTLKPRTFLDSSIIDVFADILTEIERRKESKPFNWYLPVMFSSAALNSDASSFLDFVKRQKLRENFMFVDLKDCEKIFIPVHVEKDSCGHYYLYIIHMKNQEIETWDSVCDRFMDKAKRDQTTQKLLLAMDRLFQGSKFKEFYPRMMRNIPLQPNEHDCGIFVINYMQQLDNYVREKPLFQFDSNEERLNLVLKLLKSDLNREKELLYAEVARWHYTQVESENESSCGIKRKRVDFDNKTKGNNIGLKTGSGSSSVSHNSESEKDLQLLMDLMKRKRKRMISNRKVARQRRMRRQKHLDDRVPKVAQLKKEPHQILTGDNPSPEHYPIADHEICVLLVRISELCLKVKSMKERIHRLTTSNNGAFTIPLIEPGLLNLVMEPAGVRRNYAQLESENESSSEIKRTGFDSENSLKRNNIGLKTGSGSSSVSHNSESEEDSQVLMDLAKRKSKRMMSNRKVGRQRRMRTQKHLDDRGAQVTQLGKEPQQILTSANHSTEPCARVHHEISALRAQVSDLCSKVESLNQNIDHLTASNNEASAKPSHDPFEYYRFPDRADFLSDNSTLNQSIDHFDLSFFNEFDGGGSGTVSGIGSGSEF